jgi:hypothetical protein
MSVFTTTNESADAASLRQEFIEAIQARIPSWEPGSGDLIEWMGEAGSRIGALIFDQASTTEAGMFKRFGEVIVSTPPVQAAPATVESTWTMVDAAGYTVPAGTQVSITASGDSQVGFLTVGDTVIAPEATKATILLQAIIAGAGGNELTEDPQLIDSLAFVDSISLEGSETAGGVDEEEEDVYLNRLVEANQMLSDSLILPQDFEIDARAVPGIARAKCIRNYDADKEEGEVALCQSVFPIEADGEPPSEPEREALLKRQQEKLLTDVEHHVGVPQYTEVDVTSTIVIQEGFDSATIIAAVEARLAEYLSPATWGQPTQGDSGSGWVNRTSVYRFELISEIDRVGGVDRVATLKLAKHGGALEAVEELVLEGVAPLTKPGTFSVTEA